MTQKKVDHYSDIVLKIGLDESNIPVEIQWHAQDNPNPDGPQLCKAFLLSLFDETNKDTLKIDLWTSEMQMIEMDRFMFQTLRGLADTYLRATNNNKLFADMQQFITYFGEQTEILPKDNSLSIE